MKAKIAAKRILIKRHSAEFAESGQEECVSVLKDYNSRRLRAGELQSFFFSRGFVFQEPSFSLGWHLAWVRLRSVMVSFA